MHYILIRALKYMRRGGKLYLLSILLMAILKSLLDVITSFFVKSLYTCIETSTLSDVPILALKSFFLGVLLIFLWRFFTISYNNEAKAATANLQKRTYGKALKLPIRYYETNEQGEFLSRLSYNLDKASDVYGSRFRRVVTPFISVIVYLTAMLLLNWKITLLLLAADVVLLLVNLSLNKPVKRINTQIMQIKGDEAGIFLNLIRGIEVIKIYALEKIMGQKYNEVLKKWVNRQSNRNSLLAVLDSMNSGFDLLGSVFFLGIGIFMVYSGGIQLGELISVYVLYTSFNFHFLQIGRYVPELSECLVYMKDLFDFLDLEEEQEYGGDIETAFTGDSVIPAVCVRDVSFGYDEKLTILNHFSADFKSEEMTAIVGRTGSGKSTILKLILGFYPLQSGDIHIFGGSIKELGYKRIREMIAYVPQEPYLYNVSIAENISYGRPGATMHEITEAAKAANAHEFIMKYQQGYNTIIGEKGGDLSGGERQRIAIARAILKDAPIILMDEATSALDHESENCINNFLNRNMQGRTIIIVAHRPTTIEKATAKIYL